MYCERRDSNSHGLPHRVLKADASTSSWATFARAQGLADYSRVVARREFLRRPSAPLSGPDFRGRSAASSLLGVDPGGGPRRRFASTAGDVHAASSRLLPQCGHGHGDGRVDLGADHEGRSADRRSGQGQALDPRVGAHARLKVRPCPIDSMKVRNATIFVRHERIAEISVERYPSRRICARVLRLHAVAVSVVATCVLPGASVAPKAPSASGSAESPSSNVTDLRAICRAMRRQPSEWLVNWHRARVGLIPAAVREPELSYGVAASDGRFNLLEQIMITVDELEAQSAI